MGFVAEKGLTPKLSRHTALEKTKSYGNKLGYAIFHFVLKNIGLDWAYLILFLVVPYYVIFRPEVYRRSKPYLQRRFPNDSFFKRYFRLFKYIYIFGQTLTDQFYFGIVGESQIKLEIDREAEILELLNKKPVIVLMSHIGFWEVAMAGSTRFNKKMNVMVNNNFDKKKRKSFYDIGDKKFQLINVSDNFGGMIEATNALLRGEIVGVTGDRADRWRCRTVSFMGSPAKFPIIAEKLAVATGAPVIVLLSAKTGKYKIHFRWKDISTALLANPELNEAQKIQGILELYAAELERHLQEHPYIWFNFFDFWKE